MMILDGAAVARQSTDGALGDPRAYLLACYPQAQSPPLDHMVATAAPLVARVNHGLWIVSCPCGARGLPTPGMLVFLDHPLAWCVRCGNQAVGRGWRPVQIPSADLRRRIEAVLLCRPNVEDRNWEPSETLADLLDQNREHGDPVPPDDGPRVVGAEPQPSSFPPADAMASVLRGLGARRRGLLRALGR